MLKDKRTINIFMLAMINVAAVCNIANMPIASKYGLASFVYYALASLLFFIPVALISAELATGWPQRGGVYIWVREALGEKIGFLAIWLQWAENIFWYPTVLSFIAATFTYIFNPQMATNKVYITLTVLIVFWVVTILNLLGMKISAWISTLCAVMGTILPGFLIIAFGIGYLFTSNPIQINFNMQSFWPKFNSIEDFALISGILLSLGGLEMSAVHAKEVEKPQKNYPKAILLSTILIFSILSLGALSIATVVPNGEINLASGAIEAFGHFFRAYNISWAIPIVAGFMVIGAFGMVSTWVIGPTKGVLATARHGELPPLLQKVNKKNMPVTLLIIQAIIVSFLSLIFIYMPTVSASYWMLFSLTAQLYLIMYILMFIAGIVLRYKHPKVKRDFKIPFKNIGMWFVGLVGIFGSLFALICGFFPPPQFIKENILFYEIFIFGGIFIFCLIPLIIHSIKKPSWHINKDE
jgi:glutamate:GABA antiporter